MDDINVSIDQPMLPIKQIEDSVTETPEQLLERTANWATNGTALEVSSKDGLRHLLAESRDRSSMFMSILALQRMKRVSNLVNVAEDIQSTLFTPDRIAMMDTAELLQALRYVEGIVKENVEFVNKSTEDSTTGAQILINMVDARSLTLSREDIPEAQSRESIRHAVMGLLEEFSNPSGINGSKDIIDV
jgi:hypothetical protein